MKYLTANPILILLTLGCIFGVASGYAMADPLKGGVQVEDVVPIEGQVDDKRGASLKGQLEDLEKGLKSLKGRAEQPGGSALKGRAEQPGGSALKGRAEQPGGSALKGQLDNEGSMGFSAKVEAVSPMFRPNKLFAQTELPQEDSEEGWYRIPEWRAGKFRRESQTDHTLFGDVTIVSRVDHVYGMQRDKSGEIWHHQSWPHITKVELQGYTEYKIIEKYVPVKLTDKEYCFKVSSTDIDVDNATGKIKRVTKQEEFDTYYPSPVVGVAVGECKWQGFSMNGGQNTQVETTSVEEMQIEPFTVINAFHGKNLRASFKKFLESHDMESLVPDDAN